MYMCEYELEWKNINKYFIYYNVKQVFLSIQKVSILSYQTNIQSST